ncbi:MAG: hypothetical protein EOO42_11060 [Flavobacteriales bacterium]|nr:MAG: hypothetical protein EOO42_11060 [Flavobacteriales bacterium]
MKRCQTFTNHQSLLQEIKLIKTEIRQRELGLKTATENYIRVLPSKFFVKKSTNQHIAANKPFIYNPTGKFLAKAINSTILKKESFLTKMISGFILKRFGKKLEKRLFS